MFLLNSPIDAGQLLWFVGLFEGEGTIQISGGKPTGLTIQMTDRDVLLKAQAIIGGKVTPCKARNEQWKPVWRWFLGRHETAKLLPTMLPHLGLRRTERAKEWLSLYDQVSLRFNNQKANTRNKHEEIRSRHAEGQKQAAIAKDLGISRQSVHWIVKNAPIV